MPRIYAIAMWCIVLLHFGCGMRHTTSLPSQPSELRHAKGEKLSSEAQVKATAGAYTNMLARPEVRPPAVCGLWYPEEPERLKQTVLELLSSAKTKRTGEPPIALIVPHAGWKFCGQVASEAYKAVEGCKYDIVLIIGPSHYFPLQGAAVPTAKSFMTPLGKVNVDTEHCEMLVKQCNLIYRNSLAHDQEHCIESQLPFLQLALTNGWKLIPITTGEMSLEHCMLLGRAIARVLAGKKALLIASSDMSHYPKSDDAVKVDREIMNALGTLSPEKVWQTSEQLLKRNIKNLECTLCGLSAVIAVVEAVRMLCQSPRLEVLAYANSGDVPGGDKERVVGYMAARITGKVSAGIQRASKPIREPSLHEAHIKPQLSEGACKELMQIVKATIRSVVKERRQPKLQVNHKELLEHWGVFVTLKENGNLRGCIGIVEPIKPLYKAAVDAAISAALHDKRFEPVRPEEVEKLDVEVTVLGRLEEIISLDEIEIGRHGLVVISGKHSGLLLPQVATEFGWDRVRFIEATCEKAGLEKDAWKEGAIVLRFDAQVISE